MVEQVDIERVLAGLKNVASTASTEEEFKIHAERILYEEVISKLGLQPGRYEYTFISGGRADALYGHVIIEYKAPGKLSRPSDVARAKEQLIGYIKKEAEVEERYKLFLGVILCDRIAFVRYDMKVKDWVLRGPYDLNRETVLRLVEAIRGLRKKKLAVKELLDDFGPKSDIAKKAVRVFYKKVTKSKSVKVEALFNDWKRLFSQVCAYSPEKLEGLEAQYEMSKPVDYNALLFSIHTYYAFLMKLLGAEVAYLYGAGRWLKSYVSELEDAHMRGLEALKRALEELESGGIFRSLLNITNFIEGDYFSWYLEELDEELADVIAEIAKRFADYEPATPVLEPEYTRDLLKRLYQHLVPKKIRHDLGEYYTPDWLADLVLNEVGFTVENFEKLAKERDDALAPLTLRVLDPACGSGTFLILAMKRLREYAEEHYLRDVLAGYMLKNIVGFDLNPLAVLAARTNYLLAIADLLTYIKGSIEIPIYLADSLLVEVKSTLTVTSYVIRTYVGEFELPKSIVERRLVSRLLEIIDRYVRLRYRVEDFKQVVKAELDLTDSELKLAGDLYERFLKLEEEGKDHVWTSIIKNAFAPLTIGKFDYVIGNPPWINWENLPDEYRERTRDVWENYGLIARRRGRASLGKAKRDMAMLFTYTCIDRYLKDGGLFGFLITQTVFKSMAGEGFREFRIPSSSDDPSKRVPFKVIKVHDLVELLPFEGAQNRTAAIICVKGEETKYPVPYILWRGPRIDQDLELDEVLKLTSRIKLDARPLKSRSGPWSTLKPKTYLAIKKVINKNNYYKAYAGVFTGLNAVYWVKILDKLSDEYIIVENITKGAKRKVKQIRSPIDKKFLYPLLRGRDVKKWLAKPKFYIILPTDNNGKNISINNMRINFSKTYEYFLNFLDELITRGGQPYKDNLKPWREKPKEIAEKIAPPFYMLFNVKQSFALYKVLWKEQAKGLIAAVIDSINDPILGIKIVIPNHKLMFVPCEKENEAHFICAVLNSIIARLIAKSYIIETQISTHIMDYVNVPQFDDNNDIHRKLAELSKIAHRLVASGEESKLSEIEEEIDRLVAQLYGISDDELRDIKISLKILEGEEIEEEEPTEEEPKEVKVDFLEAVVRPNRIGSFEVAILNPLREKVAIELQLPEHPVKLETDKEEDRLRVKVPPLKAGEYEIPYKVITSQKTMEGSFTLYVKEEKRHRVREELESKLDELLGERL